MAEIRIRVECSSCSHELKAKEKHKGKKVKCPKCKGPVRIPDEPDDDQLVKVRKKKKKKRVVSKKGSKGSSKRARGLDRSSGVHPSLATLEKRKKKRKKKKKEADEEEASTATDEEEKKKKKKKRRSKRRKKKRSSSREKKKTSSSAAVAAYEAGDDEETTKSGRKPRNRTCPNCNTEYEFSVLICTRCGINMITGKKMETEKIERKIPPAVQEQKKAIADEKKKTVLFAVTELVLIYGIVLGYLFWMAHESGLTTLDYVYPGIAALCVTSIHLMSRIQMMSQMEEKIPPKYR